tara:strand:- start:1198 stop:2031 length:834 start_codon:yes stop_codon:yes gene_type:complete
MRRDNLLDNQTPVRGDKSLVAVITGTSAGLGRALAHCLTANGVLVIGLSRSVPGLEKTARDCAAGRFIPLPVDISKPDLVRSACSRIEAMVGTIDILINNAAIKREHPFDGISIDGICDHVQTNCLGPMHMTAAALRMMATTSRGRIINVGSLAGDDPGPGDMGYAVSKAGARAFARSLAVELIRTHPHVTVSEWLPGVLATDMGEPHGIPPAEAALWGTALALDFNPRLHGRTFLRNMELEGPRSKLRRVAESVRLMPARMLYRINSDGLRRASLA